MGTTRENKSWFLGQVKAEMDAWTDPTKRRVTDGRLPQYLIFTTNVALSSTPRTGGKDAFEELMRGYQAGLPLVGWRVWDADQISSLLDGYPDVRRAYAGLITPNEVLAMIMERFTQPIVVNVQQAAPVVMAPAPSRVRINPGQPGNERPFQEAYDAAGGVELLGEPASEVDAIGDGFMQRLDGGAPAWPG